MMYRKMNYNLLFCLVGLTQDHLIYKWVEAQPLVFVKELFLADLHLFNSTTSEFKQILSSGEKSNPWQAFITAITVTAATHL